MAQQINVDIQVKGQKIFPFTSLTINQQFNDHHYFELRVNGDVIEATNAVIINKSKDFLGEQITITFSTMYDTGYQDNVFKGVITEISIANQAGTTGDLLFKGYSPTILMDSGEHNASYLAKNLSQIVKSTIGSIPGNVLSTSVSPANKSSIPYLVQYCESNFDFMLRLAADYGEWFFYDGTKFNFGKPSSSPTIELKYPHDISNLNLSVKMTPLNFENEGYYFKEDEKFSSTSSSQTVSGLDSFGTLAQNVSNKLFSTPVIATSLGPVENKGDLDDLVLAEKSSAAAEMVYLKASSDSPYVKLGTTVSVSANKDDKSTEDFGKYIVTSVTHFTDHLGNYNNVFEAVPSTLKVMPNDYEEDPVAEPQLAVVKSVDDPDKQGKVQVQLMWQKDSDTTPFIRVMMPHAGMRDGNKKNRGFFFTPEVGDYVIVGFEEDDPDRPFVMGSVPSGKAIDTSMNSDNDAKAIRTRSGNTIYFYDKENSQTQQIRIETDEKNYISINVPNGKGAIQIYSTDTIELQSETSVTITSKDINIKASGNIDMEANQNITIKAGQNLNMSGMQISAQGTSKFEAKGAQVSIAGDAQTEVKGAMLSLEGSAMTTIKGGIVQIN